MKFAVYVEGKAEMLFVADVLSKYSNYDSRVVGFQCINLNADDFEYVQYPFQGDENSETYYQIVNVNNDNRVISKLKQDIPNLTKQGYEIIIGLRDVFSADYDTICNKQQVIDRELISENTVYHPYNKVQEIYRAMHATYGKHEGDYHSFLASLTKDDYEALRNSDRCASFKSFIDSLLPSA